MIDKMRDTLAAVAEDTLAITRLQLEVGYLKISDYDRLAHRLQSLSSVVSTLEGNLADLSAQIAERDTRIEKLRGEYKALQARQTGDLTASTKDERLSLFKKLEPLATQLPTIHQSVKAGATIGTDDILNMLAPLNDVLSDLGFEPIGKPGGTVSFDKTRHRAVGQGARSISEDDTVQVRYVGYMHEGDIVAKAHVTVILD